MTLLAQVSYVLGAGVEKGWGLAPLEGVGGRFAAQVPRQKPHLRQKGCGHAPKRVWTCAKSVPTCAINGSAPPTAGPSAG